MKSVDYGLLKSMIAKTRMSLQTRTADNCKVLQVEIKGGTLDVMSNNIPHRSRLKLDLNINQNVKQIGI